MTTVRYMRSGRWNVLTVEGHAGYAKGGQPDIVCAAVSMLSCMLLTCMSKAQEAGELVRFAYRQDSGDVRVEAFTTYEARERVQITFETVVTGYRMLEETYPQNVRLKIE